MNKKVWEGMPISKAHEVLRPLVQEGAHLWVVPRRVEDQPNPIIIVLMQGAIEVITEHNGELITVDYLETPCAELGQKIREVLKKAGLQVEGQPSISEEKG